MVPGLDQCYNLSFGTCYSDEENWTHKLGGIVVALGSNLGNIDPTQCDSFNELVGTATLQVLLCETKSVPTGKVGTCINK